MASPTDPNVIPPLGSFVSAVMPKVTSTINFILKSRESLNTSNTPTSGPNVACALNITGVLWNGDPFYSVWDGSVWHGTTPAWWTFNGYHPTDRSYPYWYNLQIPATTNGRPNVYAGETMTWFVYVTYNNSGVFTHHEGPRWQYTYSGAWAFSPYPGAAQTAGSAAALEDLNITLTPREPNWNDTVIVQVNTSQADAFTQATIGSVYLDLLEYAPNATEIANGTVVFIVLLNQTGVGQVNVSATIPSSYAQVEGATVTWWVTAHDAYGDQIVTPPQNYTVGGNGSFVSGIFADDVAIGATPQEVAYSAPGTTPVAPGKPVPVTILSRNPTSSINAASLVYSFSYPLLREHVTGEIQMDRIRSTLWNATIPPLPIGSFLNFSIYVWDFNQRLEISPPLGYIVPDLPTLVPVIPGNASFFYVFVFDNGSRQWVSDAHVSIIGPGGYFVSATNTTFGVAYANSSREPFVPLLLPANATYTVEVQDLKFIPPGGAQGPLISVNLTAYHDLSRRAILVQGGTYEVVQEGNSLLFYLNSTPPGVAFAAPVTSDLGNVPLAAVIGLVGALFVMIPIAAWWRQIRAKRQEEERRITL